jgi:hypothetical protein
MLPRLATRQARGTPLSVSLVAATASVLVVTLGDAW